MSTASASSTPEMNTFRPLRIQSPPSRLAVVVMRCELDPASGSVMPKAMRTLPSANPGSHRRFCSSVPNRAITVAQMAGDTTISSIGVPAAQNSSHTAARSPIPAPPPPYSSGTATPR